jgi:RNA polymerase sigma factor (sigma-70 family)
MSSEWSGNLMARWQAGDQQAADELFRRYASQLVALARSRLPAAMTARVDPEDVVQSVYRSFFAGASDGRYELSRAGDLWKLLVTITLNKIYRQVARNQRGKRSVSREQSYGSEDSLLALPTRGTAAEPSPAEAAALAEEVERLLRELDPLEGRVLQMRLEAYSLEEIAVAAGCSQRTVRRALTRIRERLEQERSVEQ